MKNIIHIIKNDTKRITASVVSIVIIFGIVVIPCLYAWFNIFSNWDPYGPESTGRLCVAIATEDEGSELLGLNINIGDKLIDVLSTNNQIGWTQVESRQEALNGLYSGKYYAALLVPSDFSADILTFITGELEYPTLQYYENDKKNAIAPQITGKAKTAVQEEINSSIVKTLSDAVTEAIYISDVNGINYDTMSGRLTADTDSVIEALELSLNICKACQNLEAASSSLMVAGLTTLSGSESILDTGIEFSKGSASITAENRENLNGTTKAVSKSLDTISKNLNVIYKDLSSELDDIETYNGYYMTALSSAKQTVNNMSLTLNDMAREFSSLGMTDIAERTADLAKAQKEIYDELAALEKADEKNYPKLKKEGQDILSDISAAEETADNLSYDLSNEFGPGLSERLADAELKLNETSELLTVLKQDLPVLETLLGDNISLLKEAGSNIQSSNELLEDSLNRFKTARVIFENLGNSETLAKITDSIANDSTLLGEYLSDPILLNNVILYETVNYGSQMAAFYTILSIWVGALFCAIMIKTHVRKSDRPEGMKLREEYVGRFVLYTVIVAMQSLLVALGDIFYIEIQCLHPVMFIIACMCSGICFAMICYSLVFSLDSIGEGILVVIMLIQIAGGGGTFPIQLLAKPFSYTYEYLPFVHAMNALRECVSGTYSNTYTVSLLWLLGYFIAFAILGLAIYKPAGFIVKTLHNHKKSTGIMN